MIIKIKKRDGRTVTFNIEKIAGAIYKAAQSVGKDNYEEALELSGKVVDKNGEPWIEPLLATRDSDYGAEEGALMARPTK